MSLKNLHPLSDSGVAAWLNQINAGRTASDLATTFKCSTETMNVILLRLAADQQISSAVHGKKRVYVPYRAPEANLPAYLTKPMTGQSAKRAGTFWSVAGAMKR